MSSRRPKWDLGVGSRRHHSRHSRHSKLLTPPIEVPPTLAPGSKALDPKHTMRRSHAFVSGYLSCRYLVQSMRES